MAYPRKIRNTARRLWIEGYSYDKVIVILKEKYPNQITPSRQHTIIGWSKAEDWDADRTLIDVKAAQKRRKEAEEIATELVREEHRDKIILEAALQQIQCQLTRKNKDDKPIILEPLAITQLVSAIDKAIRRKRINRLGYDTITHKEVSGHTETRNESVTITANISRDIHAAGHRFALGLSRELVTHSTESSDGIDAGV